MTPSKVHIKVCYIFVPLVALTVGFCLAYSTLKTRKARISGITQLPFFLPMWSSRVRSAQTS